MKKLTNKSGFTLIEIIVVLIIIGVLAAIALPNLFNNVQTSQAASALQTASSMETPIESCSARYNELPGAGNCAWNKASADISTDTSANDATAGSGFVVYLSSATGTPSLNTLAYTLEGDIGGTLAFTVARTVNGTFSCTAGNAPYSNVC